MQFLGDSNSLCGCRLKLIGSPGNHPIEIHMYCVYTMVWTGTGASSQPLIQFPNYGLENGHDMEYHYPSHCIGRLMHTVA